TGCPDPETKQAVTAVDGDYSGVSLHRNCTYRTSLSKLDYFGVKTELKDILVAGDECQSGSESVFTVSGSSGEINFGMSQIQSPWIQVVGGSLRSYRAVNVTIPSSCSGTCSPYISISSAEFPESGLVAANSLISIGGGTAVGDPDNWQVVDGNLSPIPGSSGFNHYLALLGNDYLLTGDQSLSLIDGILDGQVADGEQYFILVDGDLTIDRELVVSNSGLLFMAVSGDITVVDGIDEVEGIFLADGSILIQGSGTMANLNGVWVADADGNGSGSLTNSRDLGADNNTGPAVTFTFRPDMIVNLVKSDVGITEPGSVKWEEIKP
ncbi:MAG: hypothetical protein ABID04_03915, partial [Patescibacteria group bacterium]